MSMEPDAYYKENNREKPLMAQAQTINQELGRQIRRLSDFRDRILGKPRADVDKVVEMTHQGLPAIFSNSSIKLSELAQLIDEMEKLF